MADSSFIAFAAFSVFVLALLALDLGLLQRSDKRMPFKEAVAWTIGWITLALLFNLLVYFLYENRILTGGGPQISGGEAALQFLTGYLIEFALSVDNLFVFLLLFSFFGVPEPYQHKVLFWGILGAIIMRLIFIISGSWLIARFEWILYIFGIILIASGWKMMFREEMKVQPEKNIVIRLARRLFPVSTGFETSGFFTRQKGRLHITTMLLVLITVETTDVVFATDSIPAIFAVTRDPFIIYTSNIFAILGLRSLYFVLAQAMTGFHYLKVGLSLVLIFIGLKMLAADVVHISIVVSLTVVVTVISVSVIASLVRTRRVRKQSAGQSGPP